MTEQIETPPEGEDVPVAPKTESAEPIVETPADDGLGDLEMEKTSDSEEPGDEIPEKSAGPTIEDLAEKLEKSESRAAFYQRKVDRMGTTSPQKSEPLGAQPQEGDFDNYNDYVQASIDYGIKQGRVADAEAIVKERAQQREDDFFDVIDSGVEKYSDFNEVTRKDPAKGGPIISASMMEAMTECDNVVDVAYWLGKNPSESRRIANLMPIQAAREMGRIDAQFSGAGTPAIEQKTKIKPITPAKPVAGSTATDDDDLSNISMDDFKKRRNKAEGVR